MTEIKLVAMTQPVGLDGVETIEEFVAWAARVSNPNNQNNSKTAKKLIRYLLNHKHFSPFEMASMSMQIKTTRDIARQILRHRSFAFQEYSQRYAVADDFITREARLQDLKNRQNSISLDLDNDEGMRRLNEEFRMKQMKLLGDTQDLYNWALSNNIAKEQARAVLPEGLTMSTLIMTGSLRSWVHYVDVRSGEDTQKEHRDIAKAAQSIILNNFPSLGDYWND